MATENHPSRRTFIGFGLAATAGYATRVRAQSPNEKLNLFHTLAQVRVRSDVALARDQKEPWLELQEDLDLHNFESLSNGFCFGRTNHAMPIEVIDEAGKDVAHAYFRIQGDCLALTRSVVPAMLTTDDRIIRQDCLCYLMEKCR